MALETAYELVLETSCIEVLILPVDITHDTPPQPVTSRLAAAHLSTLIPFLTPSTQLPTRLATLVAGT